jgi:Flp pilus assembly pilin Flp
LSRGTTPAFHGTRLRRSRRSTQAGQGLIEYGLILVIMAVVCVISLLFFGDQLSSLLSLIASAV